MCVLTLSGLKRTVSFYPGLKQPWAEISQRLRRYDRLELANAFGVTTGLELANAFGVTTGLELANAFGVTTGLELANAFGVTTGLELANAFGVFPKN